MLEDRLAPAALVTLYNFTGGSDTMNPQGGVIADSSGNLYGTTFGAPPSNGGILYRFNPSSNTLTVLHNFFLPTDGANPVDSLIRDSNGNFYGTTSIGGTGGQGTVFRLSSDGTTFTVLHSFSGIDGADPESSLIMDSKGNLYGTTFGGGPPGSSGTVFELSPNGSGGYNLTTLHAFPGGPSDGLGPMAGLLMDSQGNLYGTTTHGGGTNNDGTVFELSPNGAGGFNYSILHSFNGSDGADLVAGLSMDSKGNLYGTTAFAGTGNQGTVFELSPNGTGGFSFNTLHSFTGSDGVQPEGTLLVDSNGNLFGTTFGPGLTNTGTVFELISNGSGGYNFTTLHSFIGSDGAGPVAGLIEDGKGNLYGTTAFGGTPNAGTIFELTGIVPVVTSSTTNLPVNATSLVINGNGFDSTVANDNVTFDNGVTGTVTNATATSLTVSLSGLSSLTAGTALHASVTADGVSSGSPVQVATVAPVVTSSTANLPANATSLVINGNGFDTNPANDSISFSGGVTGTVTSATATTLTVTSLSGLTGGTLSASVSVNGVSSGSAVQVATVVPVVTSSTANLPANSTSMTITGFGFDASPANNVVTFNDGVTGTVTGATATTLTVSNLTGLVGGALNASVSVNGTSSGAAVQVATVTPVATSSTANLAANATSITIAGFGFDPTAAHNSVTFNDGASGTVTSASDNSLTMTFTTNPTSAGSLTAVVTTNSVSSGSAVQVATVVPVVTSSTTNLLANATSLTINGFGFDTNPANDSVSFSGGVTGSVTSATATTLTVTSLSGLTGGTLSASVSVNGVSSGSAVQVATVMPLVTSSTADLPTNATSLVINGDGFDSTAANDSVTFDNGVMGTVASATATSLIVSLSGLSSLTVGTALHASVTVDGVSSSSPVQVATIAPVVTSNTANLPVNATSLVINGDGFDSNSANDSVTFDNGVTGTVTGATATSLTVSLSGLNSLTAGTALHASVTVNGVSSGSSVQVATIAPIVTSSTANLPVNATSLIINGDGFDSNPAQDKVLFDNGVTGTVTGATATRLTVSLSGLSSLSAGTALHASATVNGVSSGSAVQVATIAPVVTSNTGNLPTNATNLVINGDGFDSNPAHDSVVFDNGVTGTVSGATATSLTVSLSGLSSLTAGTALHASVTVNGVSSGSPVQVATIAPVVTPSPMQEPATIVLAGIQNTYRFLAQFETITAIVTGPGGIPINEGVITFQVNGQIVVAPVHNGFAMVTVVTPMLNFDFMTLLDEMLPHTLDAVYSDSGGIFGPAPASVLEPAILFDMLFFLISQEV